ncbi:MAG: nucleoside recognition protein, partial [Cellulosilyticaceae bacterium]
MLNYLWSFMIIFSILMATFGGGMQELTTSILSSSQSAVKLCFETCGILAMWMGVMRIAENAGLIDT